MPPSQPPKALLGSRLGGAAAEPAAYLRVSTSPQETENQRADIERAAAARGDGQLTWFVDKGSGRNWHRPALENLKSAIFRGEVARVYVWRLDRLSRVGVTDTLQLISQFHRAGALVVSATEPFDFGLPLVGELFQALAAFAAALEWETQQERLRAARDRREKSGKSWGRPPKAASQREQILALRAEGRSVRQIAIALKLPKSTVHGALVAPSKKR